MLEKHTTEEIDLRIKLEVVEAQIQVGIAYRKSTSRWVEKTPRMVTTL